MRTTDTHVYFWRGPFSNWEPVKIEDPNTGLVFHTSEQLFIWLKADFFNDSITRLHVAAEKDPQKAKKLGREVKNFDEKRWECVRLGFMVYANYLKYSQNPDFKKLLLDTEDKTLVEASPYDVIWGIGLREEDDRVLDKKNWLGLNLLGVTLGKVRTMIL